MYCKNCGNQIDDNAYVCTHCGAPTGKQEQEQQFVQQTQQQAPAPQKTENTVAIVGFVFAFIMPLIGLICSAIGLKNANKNNGDHRGLAIAGLVISILETIGIVLFLIVYIGIIVAALGAAGNYAAFLPLL